MEAYNLPLEITFPSVHHSPKTVNRNASEFVMGTVRLNSAIPTQPRRIHHVSPIIHSEQSGPIQSMENIESLILLLPYVDR